MTSQAYPTGLGTIKETRIERPPLERATDILCVAGMLQRAAVCLSLYKRGHRDRAKYWCNDDLISFLKDPDDYVEGDVRSINSLVQLHSIFSSESGKIDKELMGEYRSLFKQLVPLLHRIKENEDVEVRDETFKKIEKATAELDRIYSVVCEAAP